MGRSGSVIDRAPLWQQKGNAIELLVVAILAIVGGGTLAPGADCGRFHPSAHTVR